MTDEPAVPAPVTPPGPAPPTGPVASPVPGAAPIVEPATPAKPRRRGRGKIIALAILGVFVVLIGGAIVYLLTPVDGKNYQDPVDAESRSANTALYATLLAAGINDPFVDIDDSRAYVVYVLPNATGPGNHSDVYQRFVLGAAADAAPAAQRLFVLQYVGQDPKTLWGVEARDVRAYLSGDIDAAEFEAKIAKTSF